MWKFRPKLKFSVKTVVDKHSLAAYHNKHY